MTSALIAAAALTAAAACLVTGRVRPRARLAAVTPRAPAPRPGRRVPLALLPLAAVLLGGWLAGPVAALAAGLYTVAGGRIVLTRRRSRAAAAALAAALDAVAGLADDLRAGQLPAEALAGAAVIAGPSLGQQACAALELAARQAGLGQNPAAALRTVTDAAVAPVFGRLAAIWALAATGVPLAGLLDRLDTELRAQRRAAARAAAQLAAGQATAGLLSALPLAGVVLGQLLGANPARTLFGTLAGGVSAVTAMALHAVGALWVQRILAGAR